MIATDTSPAVRVSGITKSFLRGADKGARRRYLVLPAAQRPKLALDHIDLEIEAGKITGVLGANGSGKSTLIRILATLLIPDAGTASVFGLDVVEQAHQVRRHVNRVSVEAAFFKEMSPWENLAYAARLYGGGQASTRPDVEAILKKLGLPLDTLDKPMKQLSRGQQQKVAIARTFLTSPSLLLMDEPTTGLDPRSKREVQVLIAAIREERAATVILSTHDFQEAEALCDRVVMLDRGRIIADGSTKSLKAMNGDASLEDVFLRISGRSADEIEIEEEENDKEVTA